MELKDLVGKHILQGIELGSEEYKDWCGYTDHRDFILFRLDDVTYKATEDPDDGYRSYMEELEIVEDVIPRVSLPNVEVIGVKREDGKWEKNDVIEFHDAKNGECVLAIGTGNTDDYYPYCVLEYTPENLSCNEGVKED